MAIDQDRSTTRARAWGAPEKTFWVAALAYLLLCFLAFCVVKPATLLYFTDYWEHRAIVKQVMIRGTALVDPIYGEAATSRQFAPWSLFLGYLARTTGIGPDGALTFGAMLVSLLFILGVRDFGRAYLRDRWGPAVLLAVLCCCWGLAPLMWTGFHSLRSQLHSNYYPASLIFAFTLIVWAQVIRLLRAPTLQPGRLTAVGIIVALSLITHPLNAALMIMGAGGLILLEPGADLRRRAAILATMVAGILATSLWPYFNPLSLGGQGVATGKDNFNNFVFFFEPDFIIDQGWPAFFALLFLHGQFARPAFRVAVVAVALTVLLYAVGGVAGVSVTHRLLAYVFLSMHLVIARALIDFINGGNAGLRLTISPLMRGASQIVMFTLCAWQVVLAVDQLIDPWSNSHYPYPLHDVQRETDAMVASLPPGAMPIGFENAALILPNYGIKVMAFPRPMVFSPSDDARQKDRKRFFTRHVSTEERRRIAARWGVTHVLYLAHEPSRGLQAELARLGPVAAPSGPWRVIALPSQPARAPRR